MTEKMIADAPGYSVTCDGDVFSRKQSWRGKYRIKPFITHEGYLRVTLMVNGKIKAFRVHRLVAQFLPPPEPGQTHVRHLNGNKLDNHVENLAWGTPKENAEDMERHGRMAKGERNGSSKLTNDQVAEIRSAITSGESLQKIADRFSVSKSVIWFVKKGLTWRHI